MRRSPNSAPPVGDVSASSPSAGRDRCFGGKIIGPVIDSTWRKGRGRSRELPARSPGQDPQMEDTQEPQPGQADQGLLYKPSRPPCGRHHLPDSASRQRSTTDASGCKPPV
ncbi:hypothetical protein MJG53_012481 [Ovis ammon polii x Ovis aries]|uniref:Uncharacterized protein n=2 Tax=Ovis TaxID=9935 RepID=A0A836A0X4_SHEEP|nr:hypothetical protein JEQ12_006997 [Ovis aries]KAI4574305.1 hypothetical protein MJG53_012481 [Ovis ammon polii x Ovis aries]